MSDIIKTQQGLARKAETDRTHHFEDLYHILCKREWIEEALQHVLDNDGSQTAGVDGVSWKTFNDVDKKDFENEKFKQQFIDTLQAELKNRTFKPMPVRRVEIPKPGTNKKRPLGIPTVKDRCVQTLLKMLMEPIWEADFFYFSNGFRPGRCTMDCVQPLYSLCTTTTGYRWVIEGDIKACFDRIPHDKLVGSGGAAHRRSTRSQTHEKLSQKWHHGSWEIGTQRGRHAPGRHSFTSTRQHLFASV
jgi:RNA-directed DNA polymerase